jgi:hypothetical protein
MLRKSSDDPTASPSFLPNDFHPRGLPKKVVIILIVIIPTVFILAIIMGVLHCHRNRNKRKLQAQQQNDIKKSLQRARRPVLAVDTDLPRANEMYRSGSAGVARILTPYQAQCVHGDVPPMPPLSRVLTAPPNNLIGGTTLESSPIGMMRSATRQPLGSHPPGVEGRAKSAIGEREGRKDEVEGVGVPK